MEPGTLHRQSIAFFQRHSSDFDYTILDERSVQNFGTFKPMSSNVDVSFGDKDISRGGAVRVIGQLEDHKY